MQDSLNKTIFHDSHIKLKAKMINFYGWSMPLQYQSIVKEHLAVREACGVFDCSHMAEIIASGTGTLSFLNKIFTADLSKLAIGDAVYNLVLNQNGFVLDDVIVYRLEKESFFIVVNASNQKKIFNWIQSNLEKEDLTISNKIQLEDKSEDYVLLAVQGKKSSAVVEQYFPGFIASTKSFQCKTCTYKGIEALVSKTGYTGEAGVEIFINIATDNAKKQAISLFEEIASSSNVIPCGLGARDSLRVEKGYSLYGQEINDTIHPIEAGLSWVIDWDKKDFIGLKALLEEKQHSTLSKIKLVGLEMVERGTIPRSGDPIVPIYKTSNLETSNLETSNLETSISDAIGNITSGVYSPVLKKGIALGFVPNTYKIGDVVAIEKHCEQFRAKITSRKFV